ncbi:hypothetical protein RGR602_PC01324 (plasmid) [Rhizobium gallicum bv. gallicum R602sp]|uniref:Uncharacterized protein n=1 Tax=Rhizobium gallicum bv. gallicum R602sp TaxID=1041138 RepID=A0A0B4XE30_9HYPH|nr:hypothetical protein RGR602_PC01324 [Rhizobium gallicum bv. gallicum R602sp]
MFYIDGLLHHPKRPAPHRNLLAIRPAAFLKRLKDEEWYRSSVVIRRRWNVLHALTKAALCH